jgi:hypothetical protein
MEKFNVYFEKRARNPLRRKELQDSGQESHLDIYNREKDVLPPDEQEKLEKQIELQVPQDKIDNWKIAKLKQQELDARDRLLRDKIPKQEFDQIYEKYGIKFFMPKDEKVLRTPRMYSLMRDLKSSVDIFLTNIRDILPNKKPRFVIKDLQNKNNPYYNDRRTAAYVRDNIIYLDIDSIENPRYFIHEYSHWLAERIPNEIHPIIQVEYKKMLDFYFRSVKKKQRPNLEDPSDDRLRQRIAKKLGLPTDYSLVNADEFFAEIITHWKNLPNNATSYKLKQAVKRALSRL